ncbi:sensor domain-containing diguanylate cyclase [Candidatus Magnetomonas plexicatena]|uniref:sensor domain-containing diguanylate cyclase n=1 Tax=Candidatus Magnetomonas plexicatena TaxID=2552947 RepID=UPI0011053524|nr:diguanylate cyclase [Nitrospirales bacterium LBB_01]
MDSNVLRIIVQDISVGVVVLDQAYTIVVWNKFMEKHSWLRSEEVVGRNIFDAFPYLPKEWLDLKLRSVFLLKNFSFTSWRQRPYLFKFAHSQPITGSAEFMYQDCVFLPVLDASCEKDYATIVIQDMTNVAQYEKQLDELKEINSTLEQLSQYDILTSAFNRRYMEKQLEQEFTKSKRYGNVFTVAMLDIDFFKKVNDTHGHQAGDEVLRQVTKIVKTELRLSDVLARYGGEEFLVVLTETDIQTAAFVCDRIRQRVEDSSVEFNRNTIKVTISLGLSSFKDTLTDYLQLVNEADIALYRSKKEGRNRLTIFTDQ